MAVMLLAMSLSFYCDVVSIRYGATAWNAWEYATEQDRTVEPMVSLEIAL